MALDVQGLIDDAKKKRAEAQAAAQEAQKKAAQNKATTQAANDVITEANNKFDYANNLERTILDLEGQIRAYVTRLGRGDKLSAIDERELNRLTKQYDSVTSAYQKAYAEGNKILSKMPKESKPTLKTSAKEKAPTAEAASVEAQGEQKIATSIEDINKDLDKRIKEARSFLAGLDDAGRKTIAKTLTDAGYPTPDVGQFNDTLVTQYTAALSLAKNYNTTNSAQIKQGLLPAYNFEQFIANQTSFRNAAMGGQAGAGGPAISQQISDPTQAASIIQPLFQNLLGREATAKEVQALTSILNDAENKNPYKTVKGRTTGGLDRTQLLTDVIKSGTYAGNKKAFPGILGNLAKEAATRKGNIEGSKATTDRQQILDTAFNNGVDISEAQLNGYLASIKAGKTIDAVQQEIRNIASLGQPESVAKLIASGTDLATIYAPYKSRMAAVLEIPANQIDMNDSTLRSAIGQAGATTLYDYEKALRKDPRWQYTNNARETVSDAALRVLKDFGFQG